MKIYGHPVSRSFRVYWTCHEANVEYEFEPIKAGDSKNNQDYLKINPSGKIPALVDADLSLFESAAICSYICQRNEIHSLLPEEKTRERALVEQWLYFACAELEQPLWVSSKHQFILPEMYRTQEVEKSCEYEFNHQLDVLSHSLGDNEFLVGNHFTLADLFIAHVLMWAHTKGYNDKKHVNVIEYVRRMRERDAFKKTKELANKLT